MTLLITKTTLVDTKDQAEIQALPLNPDFRNKLVPSEHRLSFALLSSKTDNHPKAKEGSLAEWIATFQKHVERASKDGPGFVPAVFKADGKRCTADVVEVSALVLDIDDGTPYSQLLPKLGVFAHIYHTSHSHTPEHPKYRVVLLLDSPVPTTDWQTFWHRAQQFFGHMDPATKDPCRLYFLPSHPPGAEFETRYNPGRLLSATDLPDVATVQPQAGNQHPRTGEARPHFRNTDELRAMGIDCEEELSPAEGLPIVVQRCRFMQFASAPEIQDTLPEPLWTAMLSNACVFKDSEAWIHASSDQHGNYSQMETDGRIERFRREGYAPQTCQRIRELGYDQCPSGGCLSRRGEVVNAPAGLWSWLADARRTPPAVNPDAPDLPQYKTGKFVISESGICHHDEVKNVPINTQVSTTRIDVIARGRDAGQSSWGLVLSFVDHDGNRKMWTMPASMLGMPRQPYREILLNKGVGLCPGQRPSQLLAEYLSMAAPARRITLTHQVGWCGKHFVLPDLCIGPASSEETVLQRDRGDAPVPFARSGSLDGWKSTVCAMAKGNSRLMLSICLALTGPVLTPLGGEDNFGVNLVGQSSIGKTIALQTASSVWGGRDFIRTWNATGNGVQAAAELHNDTFLALDEMGEADPNSIGKTIFAMGNGVGRTRATQTGQQQSLQRWVLTYLSTSEQSLPVVMARANQRVLAGQEVRLIDIAADPGKGLGIFDVLNGAESGRLLSRELKLASLEHYGHAGPAWVEALADPDQQEALLTQIRNYAHSFADGNSEHGDAGQVARVLSRLGLLAAVGMTCCDLGILPWNPEEVRAATQSCFEAWVSQRGGRGELEREQAIATVRQFLMLHGNSRFEERQTTGVTSNPLPVRERAGFVQQRADARVYFIAADVFKGEVCNGLNHALVAQCLRESGYLYLPSGKGLSHRLRTLGDRVHFYAINESILATENIDSQESDEEAGESETPASA